MGKRAYTDYGRKIEPELGFAIDVDSSKLNMAELAASVVCSVEAAGE